MTRLAAARGAVAPSAARGTLIALAATAAFAVQDAAAKAVVAHVPIAQVIFLRSLIAISIGLVLARAFSVHPFRSSRPWLALLRAAVNLASWFLLFWALRTEPLGRSLALAFSAPLFVVLLSFPLLGERVGTARAGAVLIGFLGIGVITGFRPSDMTLNDLKILGSAACWALTVVLSRKLADTEHPLATFAITQAAFLIVVLPVQPFVWQAPEPFFAALILLVGLLGTAAYLGVFFAVRDLTAASFSLFEFTYLPWGLFLGWLIWDEPLTLRLIAGAGLIGAAGIAIALAPAPGAPRRPRAAGREP
jgi:drug/metabolite transporter (DMT)-like permease